VGAVGGCAGGGGPVMLGMECYALSEDALAEEMMVVCDEAIVLLARGRRGGVGSGRAWRCDRGRCVWCDRRFQVAAPFVALGWMFQRPEGGRHRTPTA